MIIFREKDFALSNSRQNQIRLLITGCHTIAMELIKAIDLYWQDTKDVPHWIDKVCGYMLRLENRTSVKIHQSLICSFDDKTIIDQIGTDGLKMVRELYTSPENFIFAVESELLKDAKYRTWITGYDFFQPPKEYIKYFKYITLCLCGRILPSDWDSQWTWIRENIPSNTTIRFEKNNKELHVLLMSCIGHILGISDTIEELYTT